MPQRLKQEVLLDCARAARYSKEYQAAHRFLALGINLGKPCNEYRAQIYILSVDPLNLSVLKSKPNLFIIISSTPFPGPNYLLSIEEAQVEWSSGERQYGLSKLNTLITHLADKPPPVWGKLLLTQAHWLTETKKEFPR